MERIEIKLRAAIERKDIGAQVIEEIVKATKSFALYGFWRAADLIHAEDGQRVLIAGNVICRQRPGTAKGFVFVSLEDETGVANAIVRPKLFEQRRLTLSQEAYLLIEGRVQIAEGTIHIKATQIEGLSHREMPHAGSYNFH